MKTPEFTALRLPIFIAGFAAMVGISLTGPKPVKASVLESAPLAANTVEVDEPPPSSKAGRCVGFGASVEFREVVKDGTENIYEGEQASHRDDEGYIRD